MLTLKKTLCPTDFSAASNRALASSDPKPRSAWQRWLPGCEYSPTRERSPPLSPPGGPGTWIAPSMYRRLRKS